MAIESFWSMLEVLLVPIFGWLVYEVRQARESVQNLNVNVAIVLERITHHELRISKLEERLEE